MVALESKMEEEPASTSSSDESLDAKSDKFDPLKALYSVKYRPPIPNAKVFDNLSKYESVTKGLSSSVSKKKKSTAKENTELNPDGSTRRRFLPHQVPVSSSKRGAAKGRPGIAREDDTMDKNVLTRMKGTLGPLEMLLRCMEDRTRIKVYTRGARRIRGYIVAYVAAFDKHWNLALEDCLEVWTRKVKKKSKAPALGINREETGEEEDEGTIEIEKELKLLVIKGKDRKTETVERHVPQLMVRGEQIAIIVKIE